MIENQLEKRLAWMISIGLAASMLAVTTFMSIEPVNTPKALILIPVGIASWFLVFYFKIKEKFGISRTLFWTLIIFALLTLSNPFLSKAPFEQTVYGSFGRSTGALTYLSLTGLIALVVIFREQDSIRRISNAIYAVGIVNLVYCAIDILGPDILGWNNIYGEILGTFGNPNFIGAFFGIFGSMLFSQIFNADKSVTFRVLAIGAYALTVVEIYFSKAYQGFVVLVIGTSLVFLMWVKANTKIQKFTYPLLLIYVLSGIGGLLGILNKGPLAGLLSKASISYRGVYWETGISIGKSHPLTGVGFDAFGDYYREFRPARAMVAPGPTVTTNTAHNVPIDLFASGGIPLLLAYLVLVIIGLVAVVKIVRQMNKFDPIAAGLIVGWVGYEIQSLISINQIGLAICGWALTGALISYSVILERKNQESSDRRNNAKGIQHQSVFVALVGLVIGFVIALPPFVADAQWRAALRKGDGTSVIKVATQWPKDSRRLTEIAFALEKSNLPDDAIKIGRENVRFNPRSTDAWRILAQLSKSTPEEKTKSAEMMHKLDPLNTELK